MVVGKAEKPPHFKASKKRQPLTDLHQVDKVRLEFKPEMETF